MNQPVSTQKLKFKLSNNNMIYAQHECCICLQSIVECKSVQLSCSHTFHKECIDRWLKMSSTCPLCREAGFHTRLSCRQFFFYLSVSIVTCFVTYDGLRGITIATTTFSVGTQLFLLVYGTYIESIQGRTLWLVRPHQSFFFQQCKKGRDDQSAWLAKVSYYFG